MGDTPHILDSNNRDRYPLMYQWPDATPPATIDNYDGQWHTTDFTITLTATDDKSGVKAIYYKINDGQTKSVSADGQPRITTESASNKLEYWSIDWASPSNEETPHKTLTEIKLDKTPPTANAGQDQTVNVRATVTFDAGASTDNVGIVSYEWNFGDGTTGIGKTTTHTYANTGNYTVTLTVKDAAGNSATHSITVTVRSAEAFPTWIIGAGAAVAAIGVAAVAAMWFIRKRKQPSTRS